MGTAFIKLRQDLPVAEFRNGRSYTPLVLFLWFLTQLGEGDNCVVGDADYLAIQEATGLSKIESIAGALEHLREKGFIIYLGYQVDGSHRYEVSAQWALRGPGRPAPKVRPQVPPKVIDSSSGLSPDSEEREKLLPDSPTFGATKGGKRNPFGLYEDEGFGRLTPLVGDELGDLIDTYGEEAVVEAMRTAVLSNVRNLRYVRGILKRRAHPAPDSREAWLALAQEQVEREPVPEPSPDEQIWQTACFELEYQQPEAFALWLATAKLLGCTGDVFTVGVANDMARAWLEQRLKPVVVRTLSAVARREVDVVFEVVGSAQ